MLSMSMIAVVLIADLACAHLDLRTAHTMLFEVTTILDIIVIAHAAAGAVRDKPAVPARHAGAAAAADLPRAAGLCATRLRSSGATKRLILSVVNLGVFVFHHDGAGLRAAARDQSADHQLRRRPLLHRDGAHHHRFRRCRSDGHDRPDPSVIIMVIGVALFLRMVQTIFRPPKRSCRVPGLRSQPARPGRGPLQALRPPDEHRRPKALD